MRNVTIIALLFLTSTCIAQEQRFSFAKRDKDFVFENALSKVRMSPYEKKDKKTERRTITLDSAVVYSNLVKLSVGKLQQIVDANNNVLATIYRYGQEGTLNKISLPNGKEYQRSSSGPSITYVSGDQKIVCTYVRESNSFKLETSRDGVVIPPVVKIIALEDASRYTGSTKVPAGIPIVIGVLGAVIGILARE
jgi:hypothetical protein